jgi:hypothetical protein
MPQKSDCEDAGSVESNIIKATNKKSLPPQCNIYHDLSVTGRTVKYLSPDASSFLSVPILKNEAYPWGIHPYSEPKFYALIEQCVVTFYP